MGAEPQQIDRLETPSVHRVGRRHRGVQRAIYATPVVFIVVAGWIHRWTFDDGFIYFRVVDHIRAGHGPVFNAGERVEVATGTIWLWMLTLGDLVTPVQLEWIAVVLGIVGTAAGVSLAMAGSARIAAANATGATLFVPVGALVFVSVTASWIWTTSGLETGLTFAWLGGCWWILARWATAASGSVSTWAAVVLGAGWLIRPDMVLFSAAFFVLLVAFRWWKRERRDAARIAGAMLAFPVAYQVFRMGFYGVLIPNTGIAKEGSNANWGRGWNYLRDFADPYHLWFVGLVLAAGAYGPLIASLAHRRHRRPIVAVGLFAGCAIVHTLYVVRIGGDYLHGRLLLPAFFAICAPVAVAALHRRHLVAAALVPWVIAAAVVLRPAQYEDWLVGEVVLPAKSGEVTLEDQGWGDGGVRRSFFTGPGYYQQLATGVVVRNDNVELSPDLPDAVGVIGGIGAIGYALGTDFYIFDTYGLAEPVTSRFEPVDADPATIRLAGHEKVAPPEWVAAQVARPGSTMSESSFRVNARNAPDRQSVASFERDVDLVRSVLECEPIVQLMESVREPLGVARFVRNVRNSFANTSLRIPLDAGQAHDQLCDGTRADP